MRVFDAEQREIACMLIYGSSVAGSDAPDGRDDDDGDLLTALVKAARDLPLMAGTEAQQARLLPALGGPAAAEYYVAWKENWFFRNNLRLLYSHWPAAHTAIWAAIKDCESENVATAPPSRPAT